MIDPILIVRKINLIAKDLKALAPFGSMTLEAYLAEPVNEAAAERYLERIIGRMIDINYHLVTEQGHPPPKDYFESFTELARIGVLPAEFSRSIAQAAGLRNRIAHEYDEIDEAKVYQAIRDALKDIPRYIEHVQRFLQTIK
ncbi:MAG: DUF86 domain-containing protein [Nitrospirota bacterium]